MGPVYSMRMMWALIPRILSRSSFSKPFITASTMMSAATPRRMPAMEMKVMMETKTCFRLARRYRRLTNNS
ncbi:MAG: hypothetical protein A4E67_00417 [Syntrophaceae bacterium PtaB.Bin038]|nr:MAG: hypothetical protein A4E67_00417 [Syntrophaceae bacterium PtaB.Bin038]